MANSSNSIGMKLVIGFATSCLALGMLSQFQGKNSISEISATDFTIVIAVITIYIGFIVLRNTNTERQYVILTIMKFWYKLVGHLIIMVTILYSLIYLNNTINYITKDILKTYKEVEFSSKHFITVLLGGISAGIFSIGFSYLINMTLEKKHSQEK